MIKFCQISNFSSYLDQNLLVCNNEYQYFENYNKLKSQKQQAPQKRMQEVPHEQQQNQQKQQEDKRSYKFTTRFANLNRAQLTKLSPQDAARVVEIIQQFEESLIKHKKAQLQKKPNVPTKSPPRPTRFSFSQSEFDSCLIYISEWRIESFEFVYNFKIPGLTPRNFTFFELFGPQQKAPFYQISHIKFPNLQKIRFSHLKRQNFPIFDFPETINNLEDISIISSSIGKIDNILQWPLQKLTRLALNTNQLTSIKFFQNAKFQNLKIFSAYNNKLTSSKQVELIPFQKIQIIDLHINQLPDLKFLLSDKLSTLKILNLYQNLITSIEWLSYADLPSLETLILSRNKIASIKSIRRLNLQAIQCFNITENPIVELKNIVQINCKAGSSIQFFKITDNYRAIPILAKIPSHFNTDYELCRPKPTLSGLFNFIQNSQSQEKSIPWRVIMKRNLPCKVRKELYHTNY